MVTQRQQLEDALTCDGWRIVSRENELDWWADEMWLIESQWSPRGFQLFLTFLVDPMWEGPRRKAEGVWAIGAATQRPSERREAEGGPLISIGRGWEGRLSDFVASLSAERNAEQQRGADAQRDSRGSR